VRERERERERESERARERERDKERKKGGVSDCLYRVRGNSQLSALLIINSQVDWLFSRQYWVFKGCSYPLI
jgi:hypothetical protein